MANKKCNAAHNLDERYDLKGTLVEINSNPKSDDFILNIQAQRADRETLQHIWATRQTVYNKIYPEVTTFENDPHDSDACVIYTRTATGEISSTARIAFDGPLGIPEKKLVPALIAQLTGNNLQFAELGRFVIDDAARGVLPNYFRAFYQLGSQCEIDVFVMFVQRKWTSFYERLMRAQVIENISESFGCDSPYAVMTWNLKDTTPRFFNWCGAESYFVKSGINRIALGEEND